MSLGLKLCLVVLPIQPHFNPAIPNRHTKRPSKVKSYRLSRAKLKHVLWLRDLKASLSNFSEILIHETPSNGHILEEALVAQSDS